MIKGNPLFSFFFAHTYSEIFDPRKPWPRNLSIKKTENLKTRNWNSQNHRIGHTHNTQHNTSQLTTHNSQHNCQPLTECTTLWDHVQFTINLSIWALSTERTDWLSCEAAVKTSCQMQNAHGSVRVAYRPLLINNNAMISLLARQFFWYARWCSVQLKPPRELRRPEKNPDFRQNSNQYHCRRHNLILRSCHCLVMSWRVGTLRREGWDWRISVPLPLWNCQTLLGKVRNNQLLNSAEETQRHRCVTERLRHFYAHHLVRNLRLNYVVEVQWFVQQELSPLLWKHGQH